MRRSGEATRKVRGEAVGWNHVEPDARQQGDARCTRLLIARGDRFEHSDLTGDVEIVHAPAQAGVHHGPRCVNERAGAMQHDPCAFQRGVQLTRVVERRDAVIESMWSGNRGECVGITPSEHGTQSCGERLGEHQLAGVPIGTVNEQGGGIGHGEQGARLYCPRPVAGQRQ